MENQGEITRRISSTKETNEQIENKSKSFDKLLNSEIPSNIENIIDYLIKLDDAINELSNVNNEKLSKLNGVLSVLFNNIGLLDQKIISPKSKELYEKLAHEIINLKQIIGKKGIFDMENYSKLKNELPELVIDKTINSINETLGNNPHSILIGVNKYSQSNIPNLEGSLNDVNAVKDKLTGNYKIDKQNILSLTDENATKKTS